jgi:hypothetical protein
MLGDFPGMPGMSAGTQAKTSLLSRRKSTSALSYLSESEEEMTTVLDPEP